MGLLQDDALRSATALDGLSDSQDVSLSVIQLTNESAVQDLLWYPPPVIGRSAH